MKVFFGRARSLQESGRSSHSRVTCPCKRQFLKAKGKQTGLLSPIPNSFVNPYPFDPRAKKIIPGSQEQELLHNPCIVLYLSVIEFVNSVK